MSTSRRFTVDLFRHACRRPLNPALPSFRLRTRTARSLHTTRPTLNGPARPSPKTSPKRPNPASRDARIAPVGMLVGGGVLASLFAVAWQEDHEDNWEPRSVQPSSHDRDDRDPSLPRFRLSDVRKHDGSSPEPWVTLEDKVYDITAWVGAHPGGDVILRAAGGSIEPYWKIFSIHNTPYVREILDQYHIGFIDMADLVDGRPAAEAIEDPFETDPVRDPRLIAHTTKPMNAEPPTDELDAEFKTPNELFYVRHHMWVPVVEEEKADEHVLTIELPDGEERRYTLAELKERFPVHKVTAVLQCSGNRRNDMTRHAGKTNGLQWGVGAISNAEWEGVRLSDVLADAGLKVASATAVTRPSGGEVGDDTPDPKSLHVQFSGLEAYGSSIPLPKAIDPAGDVLLAFGMNGKPLPRDHGYPLRSVVPGTVAARSVKWLSKIVVSDEESPSQWQRRDYKSFGPNEGANPDWSRAISIQEMPITSAITGVWVGDCVRNSKTAWQKSSHQPANVTDLGAVEKRVGVTHTPKPSSEPIAVQGYAYSGGGRAIARVDVSLDGGKTWDQAELIDDCATPGSCFGNKTWTWKRWRYLGKLPTPEATGGEKACSTVVVKAVDDAYNAQPETHSSIYNVRGNLGTAWHRVRVCPTCVDKGDGKGVVWTTGDKFGCGFKKEGGAGGELK